MKTESPTPEDVAVLRTTSGLTQTQFGLLVHSSLRAVQQWEGGQRTMHPGLWELAVIKIKEKERKDARTRTQSLA